MIQMRKINDRNQVEINKSIFKRTRNKRTRAQNYQKT